MNISRRGFFKARAFGNDGFHLATMGFAPSAALAEVRQYKLTHATETRSICPIARLPVAPWFIPWVTPRTPKRASSIIEGDPTTRSTAAVSVPRPACWIWFRFPLAPHPSRSANPAATMEAHLLGRRSQRIARHMKADRDANSRRHQRSGAHGQPLEHPASLPARRHRTARYLTHKVLRGSARSPRHPGTL